MRKRRLMIFLLIALAEFVATRGQQPAQASAASTTSSALVVPDNGAVGSQR
ncbi:MAG TPA: hypothetical protein VGI81_19485 [Tepidisphaeraceae bacterium]